MRFVNPMRALTVLPPGITLDPQEERLIQKLALRWGRGLAVTVLAAMNSCPAPETLRSKGLITSEAHSHDARVRHAVASE